MYLQSFPHRHSHLKRILTGNRCSFGYRFQKQSALGGCSRSKYQYVNAINHRLFTICLISSGSISAGNIHTEVHILIRVLRDTFGSIIRTRNQSHGQKHHQSTYQNSFHAILSFYQLAYILLSIVATFQPLTRTCITGFT